MNTLTHLCRYINQQFTVPVSGIKPYHRLQIDLGLNDIELTEVVVFMELVYGLTLPDEVLTPALSVAQLCAFIEQNSLKEELESAFQVYRNPQQVFAKVS